MMLMGVRVVGMRVLIRYDYAVRYSGVLGKREADEYSHLRIDHSGIRDAAIIHLSLDHLGHHMQRTGRQAITLITNEQCHLNQTAPIRPMMQAPQCYPRQAETIRLRIPGMEVVHMAIRRLKKPQPRSSHHRRATSLNRRSNSILARMARLSASQGQRKDKQTEAWTSTAQRAK